MLVIGGRVNAKLNVLTSRKFTSVQIKVLNDHRPQQY